MPWNTDPISTVTEDDLQQLRNIIYRLENKILAAERRIEKLEAAERTTAKILNERSCDTCD